MCCKGRERVFLWECVLERERVCFGREVCVFLEERRKESVCQDEKRGVS